MEEFSLVLVVLSFFETFFLALLIYSLLSLKILDKRFFILVIILTFIQMTVRNFPVIPLVIMLSVLFVYVIHFKYFYRISVLITIITVTFTYLIYLCIEGITMPILSKSFEIKYQDIIINSFFRIFFFSIHALFLSIITGIIRRFKINLQDLIKFFSFENIKILADDEKQLSRERRVTITFYLVIVFLLIQGFFINMYILLDKTWEYFNIHEFFTSPIFVNTFIIVLNLLLIYLLRYLIITLRLERNDIIRRIKEKNALRLDWEKRAQMHDRNHHLSMLYMLLQVNNVDRAKEYLKGMVGEIQNVDAIIKSGNQTLNALIRSKLSRAKQVGVTIKIDVLKSLTSMNVYDWELNRIIGNLLDNAIEAIEKKESNQVIDLIIEGEETQNRIEVITHGVVISDLVEANIFKKGYSSKGEEGHGLGLAICKELVDEYKGNIIIRKDRKKKYTSFQVILPTVS